MFVCKKKETSSQYKGVCWHRERGNWQVQLFVKGEKAKSGGYFKDELDAGIRVNEMCKELGIPLQNPKISGIPNEQYEVTKIIFISWHCEEYLFFQFFSK